MQPLLPKSQNFNILIVSPHPDDECLMAGYALRLMHELKAQVWVLPFSLGSNVPRQQARTIELDHALKRLGFFRFGQDCVRNHPNAIEAALKQLQPGFLFSPHANDHHPVHIETHFACKVAIQNYLAHQNETLNWVQSEFWQNASQPNLCVNLHATEVIQMGEALLCHAGEVERNPYHLRLPAWCMDQARRGAEVVGTAGAVAPAIVFAQNYTQFECNSGDDSLWTRSPNQFL